MAQIKSILKFYVATTICICGIGLPSVAQGTAFMVLKDNFANRLNISPSITPTVILSSLANATSEEGEPFLDGISSGQTVWSQMRVPSDGIITLNVNAETFSPLLTVYSGIVPNGSGFPDITPPSVFTNLSLVASNNYLACYEHAPCGCHWRERNQIMFHVKRGQPYQICVDSAIITDASLQEQFELVTFGSNTLGQVVWRPVFHTNVVAGGDVQLNLQFAPAPTNDDFEERTIIAGRRLRFSTSNAGSTKQSGEPDHLGNPGGSSVWYSWTAPNSGRVTLSINDVPPYAPPTTSGVVIGVISTTIGLPNCGNLVDQNPPPIFYPVFAAYTGTALNSLVPAGCLPAALNAFPNMVEFDAVKGQTYQIALDGNRGTTGDIPFYLALTTPPPNDNFSERIRLRGIYAVATGYNAGATHQTSEPIFGNSDGKTAWWTWTAPVSGSVLIDLSGSDYSFPVAVRTGSALAGLTIVAGGKGGVAFNAVAGQTYQIAVGDSSGLTGNIKLTLQAPIVELNLLRTQRLQNSARLIYSASARQKILLQRSTDGSRWQDVQTNVAERNTVEFTARPAPTVAGPFYRAIILDLNF